MVDYSRRISTIEFNPAGPVRVSIQRWIDMPDGKRHEVESDFVILAPDGEVMSVSSSGAESFVKGSTEVEAACLAYWTEDVKEFWKARKAEIAAAEKEMESNNTV